jgi:hypothetical protein
MGNQENTIKSASEIKVYVGEVAAAEAAVQ